MTPFFYSVLLSSYFSKYWGDGCMGRLPTTNLGGDHPPVPLSLHPCLICLLLSLYMYFCKIFKFPYFGKMLKCPPPMFVQFRFFASPYFDHDACHVCVMLYTYWTPLMAMSKSFTVISLWNSLPPASCNTILSSNLSTSLALLKPVCFLGATCNCDKKSASVSAVRSAI